jgi:hypothetical protein
MRSSIEVYPNLLKEFNFKKNYPLIPKNIAKSSQKKIWWVCINNHEWKARVSSRTYYSKSCPYCSGRKPTSINNLEFLMPALAKEWDYSKNINLKPKNVSKYSNKKVWWLCLKGHGYKTTIASRSNGTGCPYCSNLFSSEHNNLNFLYPDIAKEWHPIKNANLKPTDVTKSSGKKVWWICSYGHEWETVISTRTKKKLDALTV